MNSDLPEKEASNRPERRLTKSTFQTIVGCLDYQIHSTDIYNTAKAR